MNGGYSNLIVKYTLSHDFSEKFISFAKNICSKNPTNNTLIERYNALIVYNINNKFQKEDLII